MASPAAEAEALRRKHRARPNAKIVERSRGLEAGRAPLAHPPGLAAVDRSDGSRGAVFRLWLTREAPAMV